MIRQLQSMAIAVALAAFAAGAWAQEPPPPERGRPEITPLKVQVVISRYQGEKRISSLPYMLSVNAQGPALGPPASLRMGAEVPVYTTIAPVSSEKAAPAEQVVAPPPPVSFNYRPVGTSIDCRAADAGAGRFALQVTVEDQSVYPEDQAATAASKSARNPSFRSFQSTSTLVLRDGESSEFTAATDRITGEVTRVAVTLTVAK